METKKGICENCPEEDFQDNDGKGNAHSQEQDLYKVSGSWLCGDCASEWEGDRKFYNSEYPSD